MTIVCAVIGRSAVPVLVRAAAVDFVISPRGALEQRACYCERQLAPEASLELFWLAENKNSSSGSDLHTAYAFSWRVCEQGRRV